jgi:phenylacetate-CoA ligase
MRRQQNCWKGFNCTFLYIKVEKWLYVHVLHSLTKTVTAMKMNDSQLSILKAQLASIKDKSPFYAKKYADIDTSAINTQEDFEELPLTDKWELREAYPLGLQAVPDGEVVRIHSSSGTTGTPIIIPYTAKDVEDWAIQFERCYRMAGITNMDRIHITPGYGLWTAGIGFQAGAERLGAMSIPMGPGNTDKQIKMMIDMKSTVLCATSSYALLLAEEITKRGLKDKICLKKALIGSERWGDKMRARIADELGVELYDIYGLTEIYGPGIGISCCERDGMHCWDDYCYFEIVDPKTGKNVPDGESGELVITTLRKEGAPLIRYRTHDLTRIMTGDCPCGDRHPRLDILIGRTDDMVKVKGVNIFPGQIDELLSGIDGVSSEYQVMIDHLNGKDSLTLFFETKFAEGDRKALEDSVKEAFKSKVGITIIPKAVSIGELPRSEKKAHRIFDNRY